MPPDFLGIGAQKAGTTWLHRHLDQHEQIWLPPQKELHYFDQRLHGQLAPLPQRLWSDRPPAPLWRRSLRNRFGSHRRHFDAEEVKWDLNFFFGRNDDQWYRSLFAPASDRIAGEITPAYSTLAPDIIAHVAALLPDAKLLFMMRNPIERAWSHAVMDITKRTDKRVGQITQAEFHRHINGRQSRQRGDYLATLDRWLAHYPERQLFVGFLEDVDAQPRALLRRVFRFLGVDETADVSLSQEPVHRGSAQSMPTPWARQLAERYLPMMEQLAERFGGHAERWLHMANELIDHGYPDERVPYPLWVSELWPWTASESPPCESQPLTAFSPRSAAAQPSAG